MDVEKILEAYRFGDAGKRLSLFLAYRDLRDAFLSIEEEGKGGDFEMIELPWSKKRHFQQAA